MARRQVDIQISGPDGTGVSGVSVIIRAVHPSGAVVRWPAGDETFAAPTVVQTDATGRVSVQLVPTEELEPEGAYYTIEAQGRVRRVFLPAGTDPINLADLPER